MEISKAITKQLKARGISPNHILSQIKSFQKGASFTKLLRACTIQDGIKTFEKSKIEEINQRFSQEAPSRKMIKFVPASGASSRMFEPLISLENHERFFQEINRYAFAKDLKDILLKNKLQLEDLIVKKQYSTILEYLLNANGLNYANLPKGLIKFHQYPDGARTPVEEHLIEAQAYTLDINGIAHIHFTISTEHETFFKKHVEGIQSKFASTDIHYNISFSTQKPSTETIAVDFNNNPVLDQEGCLIFRPGGHGALLANLNDLDADIIFIKNIDNITPDRLKRETYTYKKLLGGYLIMVQDAIFHYLKKLSSSPITDQELEEIVRFAEHELSIMPLSKIKDRQQKIDFLVSKLNRPLRICGMVKNQAEPGGGPFWTVDQHNEPSLQIVEKAEVDLENPEQHAIWQSATHFSPVDIILSTRDYQGNSFKLTDYTDQNRFYISTKSKDRVRVKALELPGLWNGGMAHWNTILVEVPITTFNPVKTIFDLLRNEHQPR